MGDSLYKKTFEEKNPQIFPAYSASRKLQKVSYFT